MEPLPDLEDEGACARWLFRLRWNGEFVCCRCGHDNASQLRSRPRVWSCHLCRKHHSVTAGTALHGCKLSLGKILLAAIELTRASSISGRALERMLRVSHEAAWSLLHRLRAGLVKRETVLRREIVATDVATRLRGAGKDAHPVLLVAADDDGRAVARVTTDRWFEPLRLVTGDTATHELRWVSDHPVAVWIVSILHGVHDTVSVRWVGRYVRALAAIHTATADGEDPVRITLESSVRCASRGFRVDQRPPKNTWDPSWKALVWPHNPIRLDRIELPLSLYEEVPLARGRLAGRPREA